MKARKRKGADDLSCPVHLKISAHQKGLTEVRKSDPEAQEQQQLNGLWEFAERGLPLPTSPNL